MMGDEEYRVGPGRPPLHTRFGAGSAANPQGKTSAQKKAEMANAEKAMQIRGMMLDAVVRKLSQSDLSEDERDARAIEMVEAAMLKLLKDSEDRGLGSPVQPITSPDGSMTPTTIVTGMTAQEAAEAYASTLNPDKK